ncbi:hypothetical protein [Bradyrhizobium iriomotense]|uniref:hypothetical protein n=1 Tax=Bradyrhizobium iriomotense TaxID=441950 RepID=UPI001FEF1257|nr:hypothetical protein [Bradyrhizobium iriomotense]
MKFLMISALAVLTVVVAATNMLRIASATGEPHIGDASGAGDAKAGATARTSGSRFRRSISCVSRGHAAVARILLSRLDQ